MQENNKYQSWQKLPSNYSLDYSNLVYLSRMSQSALETWLLYDLSSSRILLQLVCQLLACSSHYCHDQGEHVRLAFFISNVFSNPLLNHHLMTPTTFELLLIYVNPLASYTHEYARAILLADIPYLYDLVHKHLNFFRYDRFTEFFPAWTFSPFRKTKSRKGRRSRKARKQIRRQEMARNQCFGPCACCS